MALRVPFVRTRDDFRVQRAGIIVKKDNNEAAEYARRLQHWLEKRSVTASLNQLTPELDLGIIREGESLLMRITPRLRSDQNLFGEDTRRYMIGIVSSREISAKELSFGQALVMSVQKTYQIAELTFVSVVKMVQGKLSVKTLGGPIMIAQLAGEQAKEGLTEFLSLMAIISVNLAILNILPIPVLDGGHILFFTIELLIRRPVSIRVREVAQQAGLFVLLMLMILVFYNDITRFFTPQ